MTYCLIFCDDDEKQLEIISKKVLDYLHSVEAGEVKAVLCTDETQLWEALEQEECRNIVVFMDIYMKQEYSGISLAEQVNIRFPGALLVYLTGFVCYASDVYGTEHCYFLLKDELEQRLPILFQKIIPAQLHKARELLVLHKGFTFHKVCQSEILYLERNIHKTKIYLKSEDYVETTEKLSELSEQLDPHEFIRCHNSYIVNMRYIKVLGRTKIVLVNGETLNVSRAYSQKVIKQFTLWGNQSF